MDMKLIGRALIAAGEVLAGEEKTKVVAQLNVKKPEPQPVKAAETKVEAKTEAEAPVKKKRKRRTKAEIAADNAAKNAEAPEKVDLPKEEPKKGVSMDDFTFEAEVVEEEAAAPEAEAEKVVTEDDVRQACVAYAQKNGKDAVFEKLNETCGVVKLMDLPEKDYGKALKALAL